MFGGRRFGRIIPRNEGLAADFRGGLQRSISALGYTLGYARHGSTPTGGVHPGWMPPRAAPLARLCAGEARPGAWRTGGLLIENDKLERNPPGAMR